MNNQSDPFLLTSSTMNNLRRSIQFSCKRSFIHLNFLVLFSFNGISKSTKIDQSPFTLDINAGMSIPVGDLKTYADHGFQAGLRLNKAIYKKLALGLTTSYHQLNVKD